ncbi:MAG: sugar ABC transporter permease [Spirochaetia bacterium]|jgi:sn-glycerol 3-phosphate transport system permease protein|nr:sugar ABC transporter permease [Spirochaetia bacterium]
MSQSDHAVFKKGSVAWLYLLPTLLILLVFIYYPAMKTVVLAFYRSNFFLGTRKFIGWQNFRNLFTGVLAPGFLQSFAQTIIYSILVLAIGIVLSQFLAIQANKNIRGARIYRILLIWPFALSPAVAGTVYSFMFNPEVGIVNDVLSRLFGIKPLWLSDPKLTFAVTIGAAVWKNLGYNIVFYLAALQNISREPIEAAQIDGATGWKRFWHVLMPMLSPTTFFLAFTNLTYAFFDSFGIIDVMTKGAPVGTGAFGNVGVTTTLMYKVYIDGFGGSSDMGFAAAEGVILMALVLLMSYFQFGVFSRRVSYDA